MRIVAALAISAGMAFLTPALGESGKVPRQDLKEAKTLTSESMEQAIAFERMKQRAGQREARLARGVAPDYVGSEARARAAEADRADRQEFRQDDAERRVGDMHYGHQRGQSDRSVQQQSDQFQTDRTQQHHERRDHHSDQGHADREQHNDHKRDNR